MVDFSNISFSAKQDFDVELKHRGNLTERDEAALFAQCVEKQLLKAPATAVFPPLEQMVVNGSDGSYSVSGVVDSQNSYGATIRSSYAFNLEKSESGWKCKDKFVSTEERINKDLFSHTILWWLLGIAGTIITYFIISSSF